MGVHAGPLVTYRSRSSPPPFHFHSRRDSAPHPSIRGGTQPLTNPSVSIRGAGLGSTCVALGDLRGGGLRIPQTPQRRDGDGIELDI